MYFFDTETCGFHGPAVLLQYALDDGPITLHEIFYEPIIDTLMLLEEMAEHPEGVCGFNLAYDWFHVVKIYTMLTELAKVVGDREEPRHHIKLLAELEPQARDGQCLRPATAMDLMLHARKGPYQSTMDRKEIRIRRVPRQLSYPLSQELERRIPLKDIYFARSKTKGAKWKIYDIKRSDTGQADPDFVDICLKFQPSSALKAICVDAGISRFERLMFEDHFDEIPKPLEKGWAPFALAVGDPNNYYYGKIGKKKGYAWPQVVMEHVYHWRFHPQAREYAEDDVSDTRGLYKHFDSPPAGDDDSVLACMVGAVRWRGFAINEEEIRKLQAAELEKVQKAPKAPHQVYHYISEVMSDIEVKALRDKDGKPSTKKTVLERIEKLTSDCSCVKVENVLEKAEGYQGEMGDVTMVRRKKKIADPDCKSCKGTGKIKHLAADRATLVLNARKAQNKNVLYSKLLDAGRLHPSASVIGSLSGRMSGRTEVGDGQRASSINALGIQHDKVIRRAFPLAFGGLQLNGGDFDAYEVSIADAAYDDEDLRNELLTCFVCSKPRQVSEYDDVNCPHCGARQGWCEGCEEVRVEKDGDICAKCNDVLKGIEGTLRKIHGLFAMELFPPNDYNQILATKGTADDLYDKGKRGIFSQFYGGDENTLVERIGVELEEAKEASRRFKRRYKGVGAEYERCYENHCSMRQPGGIGSAVEWHEPADYVESLTGFRRYFTLENKITKALFTMAENPPKPWLKMKIKVVRRDRQQQIGNAIRSALFAAAFQIQAQCMRAALNHRIQSTGAILTKQLQRLIWELQPVGVHNWVVQPFNVHDEIMCPSLPEVAGQIEEIVESFVKATKALIPLIKMAWQTNMSNWAEK